MRRMIDIVFASLSIVALAPVMLVIAAWLWFAGSTPVVHSEFRIGRGGLAFRIHKFRTLRDAGSAPRRTVAASDDPRITGPGRFLRRWRLDELPQLFDVARGAMSIVGPRPQQEANLAAIDAVTRDRLASVTPGLTGPAVIEFLAEDEALAEVEEPELTYRRIILPVKARLERRWIARRSFTTDAWIVLRTASRLFSSRARRQSLARIRAMIVRSRRAARS